MATALSGTSLLADRRAAHHRACTSSRPTPSAAPGRLYCSAPKAPQLFSCSSQPKGAVLCASATASMTAPPASPESPRLPVGTANNISPAPAKRLDSTDENITTIHSTEEFHSVLDQNSNKLVVLMCKARACRPCKMFTRKYGRIAEAYNDVLFLDIYGDETKDTRSLMIKMQVQVTPTFRFYRQGLCVHSHGGISDANLTAALDEHRYPPQQPESSTLAAPLA